MGGSRVQTCLRTDDWQRPTIDLASFTLSTAHYSLSGPLGSIFFVSLSFHTQKTFRSLRSLRRMMGQKRTIKADIEKGVCRPPWA